MILPPAPPPPVQQFLDTLSWFLDRRHSELLEPLFLGLLLARGRRTVTSWFRAAGIAADFRRAYTLSAPSAGKCEPAPPAVQPATPRPSTPAPLAVRPGRHADAALRPVRRRGRHPPQPHPRARPARSYVYGHVWVTWPGSCGTRTGTPSPCPAGRTVHPRPRTSPRSLPTAAAVPDQAGAGRPPSLLARRSVAGHGPSVWLVVDGAYAKRPCSSRPASRASTVVSRLRKDAALWRSAATSRGGATGAGPATPLRTSGSAWPSGPASGGAGSRSSVCSTSER